MNNIPAGYDENGVRSGNGKWEELKPQVYTVAELIEELKNFCEDSVVVFSVDDGEDLDEVFIDEYANGAIRFEISSEETIK